MVTLNINDLAHILEQIRIAEAHTAAIEAGQDPRAALAGLVTNPLVPYGLRTVTGELNNFQVGMVNSGAADQAMLRLLTPVWQTAEANARTGATTSYQQTTGSVYDSQPRTVSNLVSDQTLGNFAAISAALAINGVTGADNLNQTVAVWEVYKTALGVDVTSPTEADHVRAIQDPAVVQALGAHGIQMDGINVLLGNVAADLGDTAPYNSFFTIFGQFFDHGLDLTAKGGSGSVYIPLQPDDPLYVQGSPTNFMVLTRATNMTDPGADGIMGTADDIVIRENANKTTPWIDLNQLYSSGPSHQVFLREYVMIDGKPMATGKMLEGAAGGPPTWADVKAQARDMLGIELSDLNVQAVPAVLTDLYGNFVPAANGMPQFVMANGSIQTGDLDAPVAGAAASSTGHAFLDDIAHAAAPGTYVVDRVTGETALKTADSDTLTGNAITPNAFGQNTTYDNELLDRHFIVGDGRGNENIALTAVHTIFHSEHNHQVDAIKSTLLAGNDVALLNEYLLTDLPMNTDLATLTAEQTANLVWDGARLFQASRFTTEQVYQHLVFEEFVRSVTPQIDPFVFSNTVEIPVGISQEFAQVVYRFGHSMLNETVDMFGYRNNELGLTKETLFDVFLNPVAFEAQGVDAHAAAGAILRGMTRQHGNEIDEFLTEALRNNLVGLPLDLGALNMARARDTGIPSLNEARAQFFEQTGNTYLKPYESWTDFAANLKNPISVINFIAAYGTHETILAATTMEEKRAAACALVFADPGAPADRLDYLNGTGAWAGVETGLNKVDFWIGGLAEAKMPFGGMLGSTFTFVFEAQMEMLQNNDRFYYLSRSQGMNLLTQLESDSFADLIQRNTDGEHLGLSINGAAFQTAAWVLEVDQAKQWNPGIGSADPTRAMDILSSMVGHESLVQRSDVDADGDVDYIKYLGGEHVVIGGTAERDIIVSGAGDDGLWGYAGDDDIEGGYGVDHIHGGEGSDLITDSGVDIGAADVLKGQGGDDLINGGMGLDLIFGGSGRDVLAGGDEAKDVFAGQGDDFIRAASGGGGIYYGNEGNDWLEGQGNMNTLTGDNSELFFNSRIIGHDVMLAGENDTDYDAESGDDIMTAGVGINRFNGMAGFDWVSHKGSIAPVDADMNIGIFANQQNLILRDRFDLVEGLSGWDGNDKLTGREHALGPIEGAGANIASPTSPIESYSNALLEQNVDMIDGLRELVSHLQTFTITQANTGETKLARMATDANQDILLGGGGSDVIKGMAGDDIIDGDKWLNMRIELLDDAQTAFASSDGLTKQIVSLVTGTVTYMGQQITAVAGEVLFGGKTLESALFGRDVRAADLNVVREIVDGDLANTSVDTAVYWDIRANYTLVRNADGSFSITHDNAAPGPIDPTTGRALGNEGTDRLTNIEKLQFADGEQYIANIPATGAPTISDTTPTENQTLTASPDNIVDLNGFGPDPMQYQWQISSDGGTTWADIAGATADSYRPGQAQVGSLLRVEVTFIDGLGNPETLVSAATAAVVDSNVTPTGALTISDTTPQSGQTLLANSLNIQDANGFNPLTTQQSFQWQSSGDGVTFTDIAGATGLSYQPGAGQVGQQLRVSVTFTDGEGTVETVTSAATRAVGNTINGTTGANTLTGTAGDDVITGGRGNDTISAGAGDDTIVWSTNLPIISSPDGNDVIDGGAEDTLGDTFQINGNLLAETFRIYTVTAWTALGGGRTAAAGTDIVITRNGTAQTNVIAQLAEIEEIVINNNGQVSANNGNGTVDGGTIGGDTVQIFGDFTTTSLNYSTITINGGSGDDVVDISALESAHRIVFRAAGGTDTVVGTLRPQDVIEIPVGADPAAYVAVDNGNGTVTMSSGTHYVTFSGTMDALPTLVAADPAVEAPPKEGPIAAVLTARDAAGLLDLVRGINPDGNDDAATALGVRDLTGLENNTVDPTLGAQGQPFIRITPNRSGELQADGVNNAVNPIFDGLDPRSISNIIGTQEEGLPQSTQANTFFMAFAQYFDHGLSFIPKGGSGTIQIGEPGSGARSQNPADLTRATVEGFDANGAAQHLNITSPFVDQNQVYGSTTLIGQFLRESDGNGGLAARVLMGAEDPSAPGFKLLPQLRTVLEHHLDAGTVFTGGGLPAGGQTLLQYYPELLNDDGSFNGAIVAELARNFMGEGQPLLLDSNPFINLLDHIVAGDGRVNENVTLTSMHTIFARNHNLHVEQLEAIYAANGTEVTAEELFQAAKIVNEAEYQRVVFTEFAEKLLGGVGIRGEGAHGFTEWNPATDPAISQEFASAVYRFGHTMIGQTIEVANADGTVSQVSLFDAFLNPTNAEGAFTQSLATLKNYGYIPQPGYTELGAGAVLEGIAGQPAEEVDVNIVDAVRNDLVRVSADLFSFNVARGRDVGIGTLNQVKSALLASESPYIREALSFVPPELLQPYSSWADFGARNGLSTEVLEQFRQAYPDLLLEDQAAADAFTALNPEIGLVANDDGSFTVKGIDRVDLWVGGLAETKVNGGIVGSTFWVVIHEQFDRLQEGDRLYYIDRLENFDLYPNFVEGQSFADIVMRNTGLTGLNERIFEVSGEDGAAGTNGGQGEDNGTDAGNGTGTDAGTDAGTGTDDAGTGEGTGTDGNDGNPDEDNGTDNGTDTNNGGGGEGETEGDETEGEGTDSGETEGDETEDDESEDEGTEGVEDNSTGSGNGTGAGTGSGGGTTVVDGVVLMPGSSAGVQVGDAGDDVIVGGEQGDALLGKGGADIVLGNGGNDVGLGGSGSDTIEGGAGRDVILGGEGDDLIIGQTDDGADMIFGGAGSDTLDLSALTGGVTVDLGAYTPIGTVRAAGVTDHLIGVENVIGSTGADVIKASLGINVMTGGDGEDIFVFVSAGTANGDVITDFRPGDKIDLSGIDAMVGTNGNQSFTLSDVATTAAGNLVLREVATADGVDTIIDGFTDGDADADFSITLRGAHNLDTSSFNF